MGQPPQRSPRNRHVAEDQERDAKVAIVEDSRTVDATRAHYIADCALAIRRAMLRFAGELPVPPAPTLPRHLKRLLNEPDQPQPSGPE